VKVQRPKEAVKKANPERVSKKKAGKEKASGPLYQLFAEMELSSSDDNSEAEDTIYPKGLHYGDSGGLWVFCDGY